jgi:hypothetical protein
MLDDVWTARSALFASFALPRFRAHIDPDAALVGVSSRRPIQLIQAGELLDGSGGIAKFLKPSSVRRCGALAIPGRATISERRHFSNEMPERARRCSGGLCDHYDKEKNPANTDGRVVEQSERD